MLAHHPITTSGGPRRSAIHPDDAAMPDFDRIRRVLRAAERAGHVRPRGRHPLWATEFWWITDPPSSLGVPPRTQARRIAEALYLLWKQRVSVGINVLIRDDPYFPDDPFGSLQSGLFFVDGEPKPSARSFRFPFVTERLSPKKIIAWGKAPFEGVVRIERKRGKGWRTLQERSASGRAKCSRHGFECAAAPGCERASAASGAWFGARGGSSDAYPDHDAQTGRSGAS